MASWVQIANLALARLGADLISSLTESANRARAVNDVHELVRDDVLRRHPWNCAMTSKSIAPDASTTELGWDYAYTLPTDPFCLRPWRIDGAPDYEVRGRKILTNQGTEIKLTYISRVTDPEQFDATLVTALAAHIAAAIAFLVTQSRTAEAEMKKWAAETLRDARTPDAQEGTPEDVEADDLLDSRI